MMETVETLSTEEQPMKNQAGPIFGLFGCGRSGTTWLGSIVNSHPEISYRFEPFHRLEFEHKEQFRPIPGSTLPLSDELLEHLYRRFLPPHPMVEKPPFFQKTNQWNRGRSAVWHSAKVFKPLNRLFVNLYHPQGRPPLVFKEVNYELTIPRLLEDTSLKLVYLVRSPQGNVASLMSGQSNNVMPTDRLKVLDSILESADPELKERFGGKLDSMSQLQKNALCWRLDVETAINAAEKSDNAMVVVYEDLCLNTFDVAKAIFKHFDISFDRQVKKFIEASTNPDSDARKEFSEGYNDPYFSVFRNPAESMNGWKTKLSESDIEQIKQVVGDSTVYQRYRDQGFWE